MTSPFVVSLVFLLAALVVFFAWAGRTPAQVKDIFTRDHSGPGFYERLQARLRRAGMSETSPGVFMLGVLVPLVAGWIVVWLWFGSVLYGLALIPVVIFGALGFLTMRERSFMRRLSLEMVPFLRRLEAQVRAGRNIQQAFVESVNESVLIRQRLEAELLALKLNRPFGEVLADCQEKIPLRSWQQFIRQVQLYNDAGGDIVDMLADTVHQINTLLQLQAELRAEYAKIAKQQYILIGLAVVSVPLLAFAGLLSKLFSSGLFGWGALILAIVCFVAGITYGQRQVKDIERKLDF